MHTGRVLFAAAWIALMNTAAPAGLVGHWDFESGVADVGPSLLGGTALGNAVTVSDASRGNVLALDGAGDYVEVAHNALLNLTDRITVAMWVHPDDGGPDAIVSKGNWDAAFGLRLDDQRTVNSVNFHGTALSSAGAIPLGVWTHVAVTFDLADTTGTDTKFYINGLLDSQREAGVALTANTTALRIGYGSEAWSYWRGRLDELRIYDTALSATEVAALAGVTLTDMVGHWDFESGVADVGPNLLGGTAVGAASIVIDPVRGHVLDLAGTADDYVEVTHHALLNLPHQVSIAMWIYPDDGGADAMLSKGTWDAAFGLRLDDSNTAPRTRNSINFHGTTISSTGALTLDKWTHVAVTFDINDATGADTKFYINGVLNSETESGSALSFSTSPLQIGYAGTTWSRWKGRIDDLRLYRSVLSPTDIAALAADLAGNWNFEAGFTDVSGNGLGGTAMGSASITADPARGSVLALNGADACVEAPHNALLSIPEGLTVSAWITGGTGPDAVLSKGPWNQAYSLRLDDSGTPPRTVNGINFSGHTPPDGATSTGTVVPAAWTHVAVTFNRSGAPAADTRFYLNGELDSTANIGALLEINTGTLKIGYADAGWSWWNGRIDDVSIWHSALTPGLVRAMHTLSAHPDLLYSAADLMALIQLFRNGRGHTVLLGQHKWTYETGLVAARNGELNAPGANFDFELVLDAAAGTGVVVLPAVGTVFLLR